MIEGRFTVDAARLAEALEGIRKLAADTLRSVHPCPLTMTRCKRGNSWVEDNEDRPVSNPGRS